jgi:hypothetical protein
MLVLSEGKESVNDLKVDALENQKNQKSKPILGLYTETFKMDGANLSIS